MTIVEIKLYNGDDSKDEFIKEHIDEFISMMCTELENTGLHEITYKRTIEQI